MAVGPILGNDGTTPATGRQGRTGEAIVAQAHGKYYEASSRGTLFTASAQAGVAPGATLTSTSCLSLHNPANSGILIAIQKVSVGYVSGTLGAGTMFHCANYGGAGANLVPSGGTTLTVRNCSIGFQAKDAAVGVALAGSTVTAPVAIRPFCSFNAILASTATGIFFICEDVDGEFTLWPGYSYQLQSIAAAGSTPLVAPGISWEEIPIL